MKKLITVVLVALFILCGCSDEGNNDDGFSDVVVTNDTPLFEFAEKTFDEVKAYFGEPESIMPVEKAGNSMKYSTDTYDLFFDSDYESRDLADCIMLIFKTEPTKVRITQKCHTQMNCYEALKAFEAEGFTCSLDDSDAEQTILIAQSEMGKIEFFWASYGCSEKDTTKYPDAVLIYDSIIMDFYS